MTENNSDIEYRKLKAEYIAAEENFERAQRLIEDKLITREHYLEARLAREKLRSEYDNFTGIISDKGSIIPSPAEGYIKDLYVREGQMVRTGDRIASVITENNMILKADIPASDFGIIKEIKAANFTTAYSPHVYSTEELNGEIISYGRSTGDDSYYIPLYFRLNFNNDLLPGTFTDIWLKGKTMNDVILVPNEALMEEYGRIYVFMAEGESFEKRYIKCGKTDGYVTHVLEGLEEGDEIVTEGTYRIKLMLQGSDLPEISHNH
ncbi:MAG: efflux RND transporter periplasmic adaptor subunit [Bacteroidales bacterium]|nr:efflux RND transporter periplasmic adaptor subunit [Bacteroidales bacterium]